MGVQGNFKLFGNIFDKPQPKPHGPLTRVPTDDECEEIDELHTHYMDLNDQISELNIKAHLFAELKIISKKDAEQLKLKECGDATLIEVIRDFKILKKEADAIQRIVDRSFQYLDVSLFYFCLGAPKPVYDKKINDTYSQLKLANTFAEVKDTTDKIIGLKLLTTAPFIDYYKSHESAKVFNASLFASAEGVIDLANFVVKTDSPLKEIFLSQDLIQSFTTDEKAALINAVKTKSLKLITSAANTEEVAVKQSQKSKMPAEHDARTSKKHTVTPPTQPNVPAPKASSSVAQVEEMTAFLSKKSTTQSLTDGQFAKNGIQKEINLNEKLLELSNSCKILENKVTIAANRLMLKEGPTTALASIKEAIKDVAETKTQMTQINDYKKNPSLNQDILLKKYEQALKTMQSAKQKFEEAEGFEKAEKAKKEFFSKVSMPTNPPKGEPSKQKMPEQNGQLNKKATTLPLQPKISSPVGQPKASLEGIVNQSLLEIKENIDLTSFKEQLKSKKVMEKPVNEVFEQYLVANPNTSLKEALDYLKKIAKDSKLLEFKVTQSFNKNTLEIGNLELDELISEDFTKIKELIIQQFESLKKNVSGSAKAKEFSTETNKNSPIYRPVFDVLLKYLFKNPNATLEETLNYMAVMLHETGVRFSKQISIFC